MISFLKLLLFCVLCLLAALGWIAYSFYRQVRNNTKHFRQYEGRQTQTPKGDTIIDNRSEAVRNKQVIKDNEGEYVDFTEVDSKNE